MKVLSEFVKERRKDANLTQEEFAERAGVALTVVRKIEQGKTNMNLDKVNLVLRIIILSEIISIFCLSIYA